MLRELHRATKHTIASVEALVSVADDTNITFPDEANIRTLLEDVCKLKEHVENGGKLRRLWLFRPKPVKERIYILKAVRVNGRFCSNLEQLSVLADVLRTRVECEKAWGFWVGRCEKIQGPYTLQLTALRAQCEALEEVLSLEGLIKRCRANMQHCPHLREPVWAKESQIERLIVSCRLVLAHHKKCLATEQICNAEAPLAALVVKNNVHPVVSELLEAIRNRDVDAYAHAASKVQDLKKE
ncbi:hypothetical protein LCGC14_1954510, partial [marine sediment metagenome]